jgi:hypothetical protein
MPRISTFRLYLAGVALLFVAYIVVEYNRPKPVNWEPTYINKDKIPYGTFVLFDQLPRLLGTDSIEVVRQPIYSQLTGRGVEDALAEAVTIEPDSAAEAATDTARAPASDTVAVEDSEDDAIDEEGIAAANAELPLRPEQATYLFVNEAFDVSALDARALLSYVAAGNDAFIAAEVLGRYRSPLADSLGVHTELVEQSRRTDPKGLLLPDSVNIRFTNMTLAAANCRLPGAIADRRLLVDSSRVGNTLATDEQGRAVYVKINHGRGHFYICSVPRAFTNYYLLRPRTQKFAAAALAYLPARQAWWDEFQKQGPVGEQSLLRVLLAHDALRAAYYLTLLGTLLFVVVYARRRQRIIPTLKPLPNTTLLFTRTVAGLYRQGSNHALIAEKKVSLFIDYLRTRFHETNPDLGDEDFRERLSQKAGMPRARVDELLRQVNLARTAPQFNDQQLLRLSRALSDFRRESR